MTEFKNDIGGALGDYSDYGDGDVDMFGLDEFGNPVGMGAGWGALIGGGASTVGAIVTRMLAKTPTMFKWAEGIGALVGSAVGGGMMAKESWRHAGVAAIATSLVTGGLRQLETLFVAPSAGQVAYVAATYATALSKTMPVAPAPAAPAPAPATPSTWGETIMHSTGIVPAGLGIATIAPTGLVAPGLGEGGPNLVGMGAVAQRMRSAQLIGVPSLGGPLAGLASAFGATTMGG